MSPVACRRCARSTERRRGPRISEVSGCSSISGGCGVHLVWKRKFQSSANSARHTKLSADRFELISVCTELDPKMQTMADFDRKLQPIKKVVWQGTELPFPVLLDNTSQSMENFGVDLLGITVLIDPTGRLVEGDESTLAAILKKGR